MSMTGRAKQLIAGSSLETPARAIRLFLSSWQEAKRDSRRTDHRNLVFIHMPKCAGTSIHNAFCRRFGPAEGLELNALRAALSKALNAKDGHEYYAASGLHQEVFLSYVLRKHCPFISGHFTISEAILDEFRQDYRFVTVLRDPVERFVSQYIYDTIHELNRKGITETGRTQAERMAELDEYLHSWRGWFVAHIYTWMLGGHRYTHDLGSNHAVSTAKRCLSKFDVVGFTDRLPEFVSRVETLFHHRLTIGRDNTTKALGSRLQRRSDLYSELFGEEERRQIALLCRTDVDIYECARKHWQ